MNTVTASVNATVRQMTNVSWWKKTASKYPWRFDITTLHSAYYAFIKNKSNITL